MGFSYSEAFEKNLFGKHFEESEKFKKRALKTLGNCNMSFKFMRTHIEQHSSYPLHAININGKNRASGIIRTHRQGWVGDETHIDYLRHMVSDAIGSKLKSSQYSAVYFAEVSQKGGKLEI